MDRSAQAWKSYKEKFFRLILDDHYLEIKEPVYGLITYNGINKWLDLPADFGRNMHEETLCFIWYSRAINKINNEKYEIWPNIVKPAIK